MMRFSRRSYQYKLVVALCRNISSNEINRLQTRQSFGSFHSDDIELLIRQNSREYKIPPIYDKICGIVHSNTKLKLFENSEITFGEAVKGELFFINKEWLFLNHGAFGATLKPIMYEANVWRIVCESQPLQFIDRYLLPSTVFSIRCMAKYLHCDPSQLYPIQHVTSGLNSIINSLSLSESDDIVYLSLTYGSTKKILSRYSSTKGCKCKLINVDLPIESEFEIIKKISASVNQHTKVVILDQITSNTALSLPIPDIAKICKEKNPNIIIVIDAAHVLFSKEVIIDHTYHDGSAIDKSTTNGSISDFADVWITNCHKWFCAPKGSGVMWISPRLSDRICPSIISHGFDPSSHGLYSKPDKLLSAFAWDGNFLSLALMNYSDGKCHRGCRDYASVLTIPSVLRIWGMFSTWNKEKKSHQELFHDHVPSSVIDYEAKLAHNAVIGSKVCRDYMTNLLRDVRTLFKNAWMNDYNDLHPPSWSEGAVFSLFLLPERLKVGGSKINTRKSTDREAFTLQEYLHHTWRVEAPIKCLNGILYVRISAHIYNDIQDYEAFAKIIDSISE